MYNIKTIENIKINEDFYNVLNENKFFDINIVFKYQNGEIFRENDLRTVMRITLFYNNEKFLFHLKKHSLSVKEQIKSIFNIGKSYDAENEWDKILLLHENGIPTMTPVAFGKIKRCGINYKSFSITEDLKDCIRLETYINENFEKITDINTLDFKRKIICYLAEISKKFHELAFNHHDFYLGHFFLRIDPFEIFLIDLQRVEKRKKISKYYRVKDIAQLYFSSTQIKGINNSDRIRFIKKYFNCDKLGRKHKSFIIKVINKSKRIQNHTKKVLSKV